MSFEHPFRENRLNHSGNYRPEWDVLEMNRGVTDALVAEVQRLRGRKEPDPGQMIVTLLGPAGYGKTHLFGRIEHRIGHEVFFVFVPAFQAGTEPIDHIRWHVVESLFRAREGSHSHIEMALARISRPALSDYFSELPPTLLARHQALYRRLGESPDSVFEIIRQVKAIEPFLKLADSLTHVLPQQDAAIVRALALGWAPLPWSATARRWLQGQDLPDADREAVRLGEDGPTALEVLRTIPAVLGYQQPMLICCDQIEGILQGDDSQRNDTLNQFSTSLMDVLQAVPVQFVLSLLQDQNDKLMKGMFSSVKMRFRQPPFRLDVLKTQQAIALVRARMGSWSGRTPDQPPTWPFNEASIAHLVREHEPTPRILIQECERRFRDWLEKGEPDEIYVSDDRISPDLPSLFLQEWQREVDDISRTEERSASYIQEDRLYRGILEALKLAHSAQRLKAFGGVRIVDIRDGAVKSTAAAKRQGALLSIAAGTGRSAQEVLVAVTQVESARKLTPYFKAIYDASAESVAGAIVIHPRRDLAMGPQARAGVENAQKAGKLRLMPLEDYPATYHATECLRALLDRAAHRDLILGGQSLSPEDCRDLVIKTGVIDNLDLFKMLGQWKRFEAVAAAAPAEPVGAAAPEPPRVTEPIAPPTTVAPPPAAERDGWAEKALADAVKKLNLLGQGVEPDGVEVGPTFARLRVRPVGKTNFKGVSNKAVDLRISLGLDVVPLVGSQAGCISIDIQRRDRAVVPLDAALRDPPAFAAGVPAFPVGLDVAGQSHWLNLADPADCHLLVAGTTGSGKSEFLRAALAGLAARLNPDQIQFLLIDPKRVTFNLRGTSPYLRAPIAYDIDDALPMIQNCKAEMERRYAILQERKLSNVSELPSDLLPRIVVVIDEFASFLEDKDSKKIVNDLLKRIGAMARAAGIHLILSTQRPDKDVVTPLLRENLPGRIALRVSSKAGSDLILDSPDAEHLLGRGDLLWKTRGELLRLQSPFVTQTELERALQCSG